MNTMCTRWDIFCNVIDNYGDIGVAWRIARELARSHGFEVRLWVDDMTAFNRIWPSLDLDRTEQSCAGVTVRAWRSPFPDTLAADVVIEAFGCALPETYVRAMAARTVPPVWINLEYLSAESWVADHHGLPSPHPRLQLTKHFFFPGYTSRTGGVLIEAGLEEERRAFLEPGTDAYWQSLGLPPRAADELRVSLFAYENPRLAPLLAAWAAADAPVTCVVPEGRIVPQLAAWLGVAELRPGDSHRRGALRLDVLPFTDQPGYDRLLWACDLNFVRGEDSCVRAQLAARPLVWQAYPQAERIHWDKLDALLGLYIAELPAATAASVKALWNDWNGIAEAQDLAATWAAWRGAWPVLERQAEQWRSRLAAAGNLADTLAEFAEKRLK